MSGEKGSSLVEVLIAIALLGIIGAAFLSGLGGSYKALFVAKRGGGTDALAQSQMEYVKKEAYLPWYTPGTIPSQYEGYSVDISSTYFWDSNIQKIIVTIEQDGQVVKVLEGYKVNR